MLIPLCERIVGALRERATTSFAHGLTQSLKYAIYRWGTATVMTNIL